MAENQEDISATGTSNTKAVSPIVLLLLLLNTAGLATMGYFFYNYVKEQAARPSIQKIAEESEYKKSIAGDFELKRPLDRVQSEKVINLEPFTVNLAQGDGPRRYVRLSLVLKMTEQSLDTEIDARKAEIRDTIISLLNTKRPEDILKKEGKFALKEQIKAQINSFLIDSKILEVYYVNFQVN